MAATSHVPAWRRLGLRLDTNNATKHGTAQAQSAPPKRSSPITNGHQVSERNNSKFNSSKRVKFSKPVSKLSGIRRHNLEENNVNPVQTSSKDPPSTKSDSFDSGRVDLPGQKPNRGPKSKIKHQSNSVPRYLDYLDQFYNSRESWKFNKSIQTSLLKDIFNIPRLPSKYDPMLLSYLQGLQGEAAKHRVCQGAEDVLAETNETQPSSQTSFSGGNEDPVIREAAKESSQDKDATTVKRAVKDSAISQEEQSDEFRLKQHSRKRAEAILSHLRSFFRPHSRGNLPVPNGETHERQDLGEKKRSRGRKRRTRLRTGIPDDDIISSSSSSSSNDESDTSKVSSEEQSSDASST